MAGSKIDEVFNDWKAQTLFVISALTGLLALLVSGYIEYYFFKSVFQNAVYVSFFIVVVLEAAKLCSIIFHRFIENQQTRSLILPGRIVFLNRIARILLVLFSLVCSFTKVSEFMESPRLESMWAKKKTEITQQYNDYYDKKEKLWTDKISATKASLDTATNQMNRALVATLSGLNQTNTDLNRNANWARDEFTINKYKEIAATNSSLSKDKIDFINNQYKGIISSLDTTYEKQQRQRDKELNRILIQKDTALSDAHENLKNSMDIQSPLIVGIFTMFQKAGFQIEFKLFQARFVFLVALFTTLLLELIIMNTFNYLTLVYLLKINKEDYDENTYYPNQTSFWQKIKQLFT